MKLLPKEALLTTGKVDHGHWNYRPVLGAIQRSRFALLMSLLENQYYQNLLEIGYGSGILMTQLADYCDRLIGIDPHPHPDEVRRMLQKHGVTAELYSAGAEAIPLETESIDCAVAVSTIEFIDDQDTACREISRVLRPEGVLVVITPGQSPLLDFGLWLLTGKSAKEDFGDRRARILNTLVQHFRLEKEMRVPAYFSSLFTLYRGLYLRKP